MISIKKQNKQMGKLKPLKGKEKLVDLDPLTLEWLDSIPSRTEKNRFQYHFNRLKKSMFCNLEKDKQISARFDLIIETLSEEIPTFEVLNGGKSYKRSTIY